jgi:hypothetical protein
VAKDQAHRAHLTGRLAMHLGQEANFPSCSTLGIGYFKLCLSWTRRKIVFGNAPTQGRPTKVMSPGGLT